MTNKKPKSFTFNVSNNKQSQMKARDNLAIAGCTRVFIEELGYPGAPGGTEAKTDNPWSPGKDDGFFC